MKIILSPAKSLDFENARIFEKEKTKPVFIEESEYLINKLKKYSSGKIKKLMNVSDNIAQLNFERFQSWEYPFPSHARQALFVFNGDAYRGLDANSFSDEEVVIANEKLRILSGLYGLLKPLDLMLPYRLEMGTPFKVTPTKSNLYKFWGTKLAEQLESEMNENEVLVNVASNEYSKALNLKNFNRRVITCSFKEEKNGDYKAIMTFAKRARGLMTRFIIQENINEPEHLKAFDLENYSFNESLSSENEFVFTR
ncbi:peroxide stress protein YaaA [Parvicella tangerina]|uniref:UPF0246 protein CRYO30217_01552 n=1 Tax=Parvicella tangerina TaxID=2829795 RepID=A0A916NGS1_9FLAO|nr:peroxide stress protein YaaA [Parvicella tangerina]CAG5081162.1 Peroxide stress resistance protein YaaA [Parvicella tangerina]